MLLMQVFISEKLYEEEEVDLPIPIIYYSRFITPLPSKNNL